MAVNESDKHSQQGSPVYGGNDSEKYMDRIDGGVTAWLQVLSCFWLWFVVWGIVNSFGVFQAYYESDLLRTRSSSDISWIGSLQLCIFMLGTIIVGPLFDIGYLQSLLVAGGFLVVLGLMMTSLCTQYWQFILAQGLCMGVGMACLFAPSIALIPPFFERRRSLAVGIAATGSTIGAIVISIAFQQLVPQIGFGWATRVIGFIVLLAMVAPVLVSRKRAQQSEKRGLFDLRALTEPPFALFMFCMFFAMTGLYVPFFYIQVFSEARHVVRGSQTYLNNYLVILLNAGSFFGRLLPNLVADSVGPLNTLIPCTAACAVLALCWIAVSSEGGIVTFAILYGFFSGAFVSLVPAIWTSLCPDPSVLGRRSGMMAVPMGIGLLIGNPVGGALIEGDSFWRLQVWCGVIVLAASSFAAAARVAKTGLSLSVKL